MNENMIDHAKKQFATHKATLILDSDRYTAIDWRRADGDGHYYINFIVDKLRGSLIVSGNLGYSIATWYISIKISSLARYIYTDISYYVGKMQCTSNKYKYDPDKIFKFLWNAIGLNDSDYLPEFVESVHDEISIFIDSEEELIAKLNAEIGDSIRGHSFIPTEDLYKIVTLNNPDNSEYFREEYLGEIHNRVYLWAYGFHMACEQLNLL